MFTASQALYTPLAFLAWTRCESWLSILDLVQGITIISLVLTSTKIIIYPVIHNEVLLTFSALLSALPSLKHWK